MSFATSIFVKLEWAIVKHWSQVPSDAQKYCVLLKGAVHPDFATPSAIPGRALAHCAMILETWCRNQISPNAHKCWGNIEQSAVFQLRVSKESLATCKPWVPKCRWPHRHFSNYFTRSIYDHKLFCSSFVVSYVILPARLQKLVSNFCLHVCREILRAIWREFCRISSDPQNTDLKNRDKRIRSSKNVAGQLRSANIPP